MIGAQQRAPLLFVGINPRVSPSNQYLHDTIVGDVEAFAELAHNRVRGRRYIALDGIEPHYMGHAEVADALFPGVPFENVAAVTELHHCASSGSTGLPYDESICATTYLAEVLAVVEPTIVFAVGRHVERTLRRMFGYHAQPQVTWDGGHAPLLEIPHPNSRSLKLEPRRLAVECAREILRRAKPAAPSA